MTKKKHTYVFENWFSICIPEFWEHSVEEDILNIYQLNKGKGVIQISFYQRVDSNECLPEVAKYYLNKFIEQYDIKADLNTFKVIETPDFTLANTIGECEEKEFIKAWVIVNRSKMLLVTYISLKKTKELSVVDDIIYSINLDNDKLIKLS